MANRQLTQPSKVHDFMKQMTFFCNRFFLANEKCRENNIVDQWETMARHKQTNMANRTTRATRNNRNNGISRSSTTGTSIDDNDEAAASTSIHQVSMQMGTNIGPIESLPAREGSKSDEIELDASGSKPIDDSNLDSALVMGNESPTQTIRDGLISTTSGVSSGVFTDLNPQQWAAPQCPECELEPTQDLRALRLAFATPYFETMQGAQRGVGRHALCSDPLGH
jgi:hypothetical protein